MNNPSAAAYEYHGIVLRLIPHGRTTRSALDVTLRNSSTFLSRLEKEKISEIQLSFSRYRLTNHQLNVFKVKVLTINCIVDDIETARNETTT